MDDARQGSAADPASFVFTRRDDASPLSARPRGDRLLALVITALVHVLLVALLREDGQADTGASTRDDALQVTWIERPLPQPAAQDVPTNPPERSRPRTPSARRALPARLPDAVGAPVEAHARDEAPSQVTAGDDAWPRLQDRRRDTYDIDPSAFRRDPLARKDDAFAPAPARMESSIRDRSFGGWMQRATKARICGDLAAQLRKAPESADAIMGSMRRHGCKG